jgi:hypothetical protein
MARAFFEYKMNLATEKAAFCVQSVKFYTHKINVVVAKFHTLLNKKEIKSQVF